MSKVEPRTPSEQSSVSAASDDFDTDERSQLAGDLSSWSVSDLSTPGYSSSYSSDYDCRDHVDMEKPECFNEKYDLKQKHEDIENAFCCCFEEKGRNGDVQYIIGYSEPMKFSETSGDYLDTTFNITKMFGHGSDGAGEPNKHIPSTYVKHDAVFTYGTKRYSVQEYLKEVEQQVKRGAITTNPKNKEYLKLTETNKKRWDHIFKYKEYKMKDDESIQT